MAERRKPLFRLLAAVLAAGLLAGCSMPALEWLPHNQPAENRTDVPSPAASAPLVVLLEKEMAQKGSFVALLDAYSACQGTGTELLVGDAAAGRDQAGLVLLARQPGPDGWLDLAAEPLLGVLAQGAAALPGLDAKNGCPALPLGFAGYGYLADRELLQALLGDGFDPALLAGASWDEWQAFAETLGGWIESPAGQTVTLSGQSFSLPAEKPAAAQNLTGVFAPPAGPEGYAGSALSPALCAAFAAGGALSADPERLTGPLNGAWAAFRLEQEWAAPGGEETGGETQTADGQTAGAADSAALLESGRAVFCRAPTGGLSGGASAEFLARLVLVPFKTNLDETDLAPDSGYSLEALNGWPVAGTPGWLAVSAGADPEQQALAEGFLLWLFASAEGQQALEETMGAISLAGASAPQSPALQQLADALRTGQALPDLAQGFAPGAHARASEAFDPAAGDSGTGGTARSEWAAAVLDALAGGE